MAILIAVDLVVPELFGHPTELGGARLDCTAAVEHVGLAGVEPGHDVLEYGESAISHCAYAVPSLNRSTCRFGPDASRRSRAVQLHIAVTRRVFASGSWLICR